MTTGYSIEMQTEGMGENKREVRCKVGGHAASTDKVTGEKRGFQLKSAEGNKLPMLKVKLSNPAHSDHRFEVRWSNYHEQMDIDSPGTFKLVRVDIGQPQFIYVLNEGRKMMHRGRPCIDYAEMAVRYGSHYDTITGKWTFGENQPIDEVSKELVNTDSLHGIEAALVEQFGEDLTDEVLSEIVTHSLFLKFVGQPTTEKKRRRAAAA